jgi:hypothetical protein
VSDGSLIRAPAMIIESELFITCSTHLYRTLVDDSINGFTTRFITTLVDPIC